METIQCFKLGCMLNAEASCSCTSPETYLCVLHVSNHLKLLNKHNLSIISMNPSEEIKEAILLYLSKEKSGNSNKKWLNPLRLLSSENDLNDRQNDTEQDQEFKRDRPYHNNNIKSYALPQLSHQISHKYHQSTSLYLIDIVDKKSILFIYDTESKLTQAKTLDTPKSLDSSTSITLLPNGKLFCFGSYSSSGDTLIIDTNGQGKQLSSMSHCFSSSVIYFNKSVYCFGGSHYGPLTLSTRFDLDENRWIKLASMPKRDENCSSIIINGNILITGRWNKNIFLYSIEIDSFSTIPYVFAKLKRKLLISAEERLYLIECGGLFYESEIASATAWRWIGVSEISYIVTQAYWTYNKGEIWIGCNYWGKDIKCYMFNLNEKVIIKVQ